MSYEDFDIQSLADYLHLRPEQVTRMAERGQLPGRRIGGQWRFSSGEIHHWWEDRIGLSGEEELAQVELALQRDEPAEAPRWTLAQMLPPAGVAIPLAARTRNSVITEMVRLADGTGLLWDEEKMATAVRARENLHPTALDNGVALLHPRRPLAAILAEPFLVVGKTVNGIPFGGATLTDVFFLIGSCEDRGHLRTLARLSRLIGDSSFLSQLRGVVDAREVRPLIEQFESQLPE